MRNVFTLIDETKIVPASSYITSYRYLLELLAGNRPIREGDVARACHMVYGWMPTILELGAGEGKATLVEAAEMLEQARAGHSLSKVKLTRLSGLVNNSMVGASKLLHFAAPDSYAIWDSRIYFYIYGKKPHHYQVNDAALYLQYLSTLRAVSAKEGFNEFHGKVNEKVGYPVSAMRAIELVMFENGRPVEG